MEIKIRISLAGLLMALGCHAVAHAQVLKCGLGPIITVSCPTDIAPIGSRVTVSGNISGGDPNASFSHDWEVSTGKIVSGQGTPTITIEVGAETTTATLKVSGGGLTVENNRTASCTFSNIRDPESARKFAVFAQLRPSEEEERLRAFAAALEADAAAQGYVLAYEKRGFDDHVPKRLTWMKKRLVQNLKIAPERIVTINGGIGDSFGVELWIVPAGAQPPTPQPEL
jgi:hypothetical protein